MQVSAHEPMYQFHRSCHPVIELFFTWRGRLAHTRYQRPIELEYYFQVVLATSVRHARALVLPIYYSRRSALDLCAETVLVPEWEINPVFVASD